MRKFEVYRRVLPSLPPIIFRNFFVLVNGIIFVVVVLLFVFGSTLSALFLGIVFLLNTLIAIAQDIHARIILERLQMLTALRVVRINSDEKEESVLAEEIKKGDFIKLKLGDQAPCEGVLISIDNLEISEALITGESDSFTKKIGEKIIAGAIVTSGYGVMEASGLFRESRLAQIAGDVKKYAASPSSIQTATNTIIKYSSYILLLVLLLVIYRGILVHESRLDIVTNSGALASALVPQGLVVVITLLFAVGAAGYSKRNVLFQEINATEKLGRIKNLCIDKTGTLTDNILVVESMSIPNGLSELYARTLTYACIVGFGDSSEIILAVKKYLEKNLEQGDLEVLPPSVNKNSNSQEIKINSSLPFSSWRRYGAIEIDNNGVAQTVFIGAPDIILARISNSKEKELLENILKENTYKGKRVLAMASARGEGLSKDLGSLDLALVSVFVFHNTLREGIQDTIKFFQDRQIQIRVLSGDNAMTVQAVAGSVGIDKVENMVTGSELESWSDSDFEKRAHEYTIFAQVLPEHKVKLIEAFKKKGFTAMVGDGVNDALAMKKSDLGIAMFDGVPVTRQLADVILMTNSFSDLPGAVELADHFIRSIEITSGIYINQCLVGLFFFIIISIFGYSFPLTPLNITFINYFTVGFAGILIAYWALRPSSKILRTNEKPFLQRVMPLVFYCAIFEAIGTALILILSPDYLKTASSNTLVGLAFILFGFIFLLFATKVYCGILSKKEKFQLFLFGLFELVALYLVLQIPFIIKFFNITEPFPSFQFISETVLIILLFAFAQYIFINKFFLKK